MLDKSDDLGNRMKEYEAIGVGGELMPNLPTIVRLDGRSFHNFTKGLDRPWDISLIDLMNLVTKCLMEETNAVFGYVQSDEISLMLYSDRYGKDIYFGSKKFKIVSILSSLASVLFNKNLPFYLPKKIDSTPLFDARVFQVPSETEAVNYFLWRQRDAIKNSISMMAQTYFSHKELDGKNQEDRLNMLRDQGIKWADAPEPFKGGTFYRFVTVLNEFTPEQIAQLPEKHDYFTNPELLVKRRVLEKMYISERNVNYNDILFQKEYSV